MRQGDGEDKEGNSPLSPLSCFTGCKKGYFLFKKNKKNKLNLFI
jgi:hypothetical protein